MTYYKFNRLWIVSIDFIIQLKFKLNNLLGDWIVLHDMKKNQINVEGKWKKKVQVNLLLSSFTINLNWNSGPLNSVPW